ncbi:MAG: sodium-dependent transporter [Thermodesulfobacteriota bacterium]|nr:sodium-dependent transporter [Thermodesulfobacteriota bacterium]
MAEREHWKNRSIFIMAAVGSAIGLGNMWRFPYIAAQNGGGAFLIPYMTALLTAGIPLMIIEYGLGIRTQGSAYIALGKIKKPLRFIGWMAILCALFINIYYCMVLGWAWHFLLASPDIAAWGADLAASKAHFYADVLHISEGPWDFKAIYPNLFWGLLVTWVAIWAIIRSGLSGIGKVLLFTVPLPVILVLILLVQGLTLEGSAIGLNHYLTPDWGRLADYHVWLAAYGQIFFSLSVGFGTMIAYASFMPEDTELPNSAAITSFSNCCFSFLAGLAVFSVLGYFAVATNVHMTEVSQAGPGLAFIVYPAALARLPVYVTFFGALFFVTLLLLGIDSAFSLLETVSAALSDKFGITRPVSTTITAVFSFLAGLPLATGAGIYWLDIMDHFIMAYAITTVAIVECLAVGWILGAKNFTAEINRHAEIKIGPIFSFIIRFLTPAVLGYSVIRTFVDEMQAPYEGYPPSAVFAIGLGTLALIMIIGAVLTLVPTKSDRENGIV